MATMFENDCISGSEIQYVSCAIKMQNRL